MVYKTHRCWHNNGKSHTGNPEVGPTTGNPEVGPTTMQT